MSDRDAAEEKCHLRIERAEPDRLFAMRDRFAVLPGEREDMAEISYARPQNSD